MRNPTEADITELDPETQAIVDEVCTALDEANADPWGGGAPLPALGEKWLIAMRATGDHELRQRIFAAMDANVRSDPTLFIAAGTNGGSNGYIYTQAQISKYDGTLAYERGEDGEMRRVLKFPTAYYANGSPCYDRRDDAA